MPPSGTRLTKSSTMRRRAGRVSSRHPGRRAGRPIIWWNLSSVSCVQPTGEWRNFSICVASGAAAAQTATEVDLAQGLAEGNPTRAAPVDHRVVFGMRGVEQVAVFDEEQPSMAGGMVLESWRTAAGDTGCRKGDGRGGRECSGRPAIFAIIEKALADDVAKARDCRAWAVTDEASTHHARQKPPKLHNRRCSQGPLMGSQNPCLRLTRWSNSVFACSANTWPEIQFLHFDPG